MKTIYAPEQLVIHEQRTSMAVRIGQIAFGCTRKPLITVFEWASVCVWIAYCTMAPNGTIVGIVHNERRLLPITKAVILYVITCEHRCPPTPSQLHPPYPAPFISSTDLMIQVVTRHCNQFIGEPGTHV